MSRRRTERVLVAAPLLAAPLLLVALFPVLWTVLNSFKSLRDIVSPIPVLLFRPTLANYATVLATPSVRSGLGNSVVVATGAVSLGIVLGWPAAHALARMTGRAKRELLFTVLSMRFMPPVAVAIPLAALSLDLGLYDTRFGLILAYGLISVSTIVWMSVPAFENVPRDVEEAAELDGYGPFAVFGRVSLPLAAPALLGGVLFTFVLIWNELLIALVLTARHVTLPVVASSFATFGMEVPWGVINASAILLSVPPILFLGLLTRFLRRFFCPPNLA